MFFRIVLSSLLLIGGLFIPYSPVLAAEYGDIPQTHWAWPFIERLSTIGVLRPFTSQQFMGEEPVTRYEYLQSLAALVDYIDAHSGKIVAELEVQRYAIQQEEAFSSLESKVIALEAQYEMQNMLIQKLDQELTKERLTNSSKPAGSNSTSDYQVYGQRLSQLEQSVITLEKDLEKKNDHINQLYFIVALLAATSILK